MIAQNDGRLSHVLADVEPGLEAGGEGRQVLSYTPKWQPFSNIALKPAVAGDMNPDSYGAGYNAQLV